MSLRILVLGSTGQLGSELIRSASARSIEVLTGDRTDFDTANSSSVVAFLKDASPDLIINCVAYTAVDKAENDVESAFQVNQDFVQHLGDYASVNRKSVVHFSTDYVFDGQKKQPYIESDTTNPLSVYGQSKFAGEQALLRTQCKGAIFRTSWLYSNSGHNFFKTMIRLGRERELVRVVDDQVGTPTFAFDLADFVISQRETLYDMPGELFHFSNGGSASWCEFATEIFSRSGLKSRVEGITTAEYPVTAVRPLYGVLDKSKVIARFDARIDHWATALQRCLELSKL